LRKTAEEKQDKKRDPNNPSLLYTDPQGVSLENEFAYSARDTFPVSPGHTVVFPKRYVARFFDLMPDEVTASMDLINEEKKIIDEEFNPDGYNIQLAV
jgi:diadenosine tetraphosphate (Ap4A) HIT family hydrolase